MGEVVPLRDHLEQEIEAYERHHSELHAELQRAIDKSDQALAERTAVALAAIDRRLDAMNEFRASLEDVTNHAVSRDLFDIVTNRVTVIENTYLQKEDYGKDTDTTRDRYLQDLKVRDDAIAKLEQNTVKIDALNAQRAEVDRTRKALVYAIITGVVLTVFNLIVNIVQSKP